MAIYFRSGTFKMSNGRVVPLCGESLSEGKEMASTLIYLHV